jgi:hypothetical protein
MRSRARRLVGILVVGVLAWIAFGCRKEKEEESPRPETKVTPPAAYAVLLPDEEVPPGWKQSGAVRSYVGEKLFDSIDGAAERFFQYDFRTQYVASYASDDSAKTMQVEVYDMGSADDAFGMFTCHDSIASEHAEVGSAATISDMNVDFCQGKYFLRLLAMGFDEGEAQKPLLAFAKAIAGNIEWEAGLPELVGRLPEGYVEGTLLFFHTWQTLKERRYIAEENVLHLDKKTNCLLAAYTFEERTADDQTIKLERDILYLMEYPDEKTAQGAKLSYVKFLKKRVADSLAEGAAPAGRLFLTRLPEEPIEVYQLYKGEEGQQRLIMNMRVLQNSIFGFWEITDANKAKELLKNLATNLKK